MNQNPDHTAWERLPPDQARSGWRRPYRRGTLELKCEITPVTHRLCWRVRLARGLCHHFGELTLAEDTDGAQARRAAECWADGILAAQGMRA